MSNDPYGQITGFAEKPVKKKTKAKAKAKAGSKKKTYGISLSSIVDEKDLDDDDLKKFRAMQEMREGALAVPVPKQAFQLPSTAPLPRYMKTNRVEFSKNQIPMLEHISASKRYSEKLITSLIMKLSNVNYDVSDIVNYIVEANNFIGMDFIIYISNFIVVLTNARASKFDTLIFAIQSQQLTGQMLEQAVNDNIVNFNIDDIEFEQNTLEISIRLVVMSTSRRPNRPRKPIGIGLPNVEIVNYEIDFSRLIITDETDDTSSPFDSTATQYLIKPDQIESNAFMTIMRHIDDLVAPSSYIDPQLEITRLKIINALRAGGKGQQGRKKKKTKIVVEDEIGEDVGQSEDELSSLNDEGSYKGEDEEEDGFAPICYNCEKPIPKDVSLKTKRVRLDGRVEDNEFCCIDPCFLETKYKYKK